MFNLFPKIFNSSSTQQFLSLLPVDASYQEKIAHWKLILISNPQLSFHTLDQIAESFGLADDDVFYAACSLRNLTYLEHLARVKTPQQFQKMISKNQFSAFSHAVSHGHLEVLQYFEEKAPRQLQAMIAAEYFGAFRNAAIEGNLEGLNYLEEKAPGQLQAMIAEENFFAFRWAAKYGQLQVLHYLEEKASEQLQAMISAQGFYAFKYAAGNGHLHVLHYLEEKAPEQLQAMITDDNFNAYISAAREGQIDVLHYLEEKVIPEQLQVMIASMASDHFDIACLYPEVTDHLLQHASVLAFAEPHTGEFGETVFPFITRQLDNLHAEKRQIEETNVNVVFDVNEKIAKCCFYILRNLIRRNEPALLDEIRFLISIPAVKNLVHREVTIGQSNELLRLALSISNAAAAELLLTLPEVNALAQQNQYYPHLVRGGLDLHALAQDRESSMTALSVGEQKRLKTALDHYNVTLRQEGMVPNLMTSLKETLKERFTEHPATIEIERTGIKQQLDLPMLWEDFVALDLTPEERLAANKAYYQHKDHSAWRYLSKPNPWMHAHAGYVYISDDRTQRWSTFEEYQPLIALLFLAAQDENIPAEDEFTLETRLEHFIGELALIGRAHNWDTTRFITDEEGNPIADENGNLLSEEYDDLKGDRPSCFSGVKRRLFQSLQGHPMFKMLTKGLIETEIRNFVRNHFQIAIPQNNPLKLKEAWDDLVFEGNQEVMGILKSLDISAEQQKEFLSYLDKKYGLPFTEDIEFLKYVNDAFKFLKPENDCHAVYFAERVDLAGLLEKAVSEQISYAENPNILFKIHLAQSEEKESPELYSSPELK